MITRKTVVNNPLLAGKVVRYHTWPVQTKQTVGEHSYNCMMLYWLLWGPLPPTITAYFIWHDAGELVVGDLPFPVKSRNGILKATMDELEHAAVLDMGGNLPELTDHEKVRVKCVDLLEMYCFGSHELLLGNQYAQPIIDDTFAVMEKLPLSSEDGFRVFEFVAKVRGTVADTLMRW